jgi:hypothetical protein
MDISAANDVDAASWGTFYAAVLSSAVSEESFARLVASPPPRQDQLARSVRASLAALVIARLRGVANPFADAALVALFNSWSVAQSFRNPLQDGLPSVAGRVSPVSVPLLFLYFNDDI